MARVSLAVMLSLLMLVSPAVAADFFPGRTLRLGAVYDDGYESWWLLAEKFLTPRASLLAAYATSDFLGEGFRLEAAWRF